MKLNTDASLDQNGGSLGGILSDNDGMAIAIFSELVDMDEIYARKLQAISKGIELVLKMGYYNMWYETDSKFAADIINGTSKIPWKLHSLVSYILVNLAKLQSWRLTHTWREASMVGDYLSKRDCIVKGFPFALPLAPPKLLDLINLDREGHVYFRL
ncbi:uncharacterized protein LOC143880607 [Tasmannia lanceolata]|uniref:uncharacterized protein LOC143880607 n=1 Tax=Tasmannia lanceolata TaxID=3420 RepID=UPI004063AC7F